MAIRRETDYASDLNTSAAMLWAMLVFALIVILLQAAETRLIYALHFIVAVLCILPPSRPVIITAALLPCQRYFIQAITSSGFKH